MSNTIVKSLIKQRGVPFKAVAKILDMSDNGARYVLENRAPIKYVYISRLAQLLNVSPLELIDEQGQWRECEEIADGDKTIASS